MNFCRLRGCICRADRVIACSDIEVHGFRARFDIFVILTASSQS